MEDIKQIVKEKFKAFALHFALSLLILTLIISFIYLMWYPSSLLEAVGGGKILWLIILIDVILGPILTFIVYKKHKKTLKMDLVVIGCVQLLALGLGVSSLALAKPVWIVFNGNKFELIQRNEIIQLNEDIPEKYQSSRYWSKPEFVAVELSSNAEIRQKQIMDEVFSGISLAQQPAHYVEIEKIFPKFQSIASLVAQLYQYNDKSTVDKILADHADFKLWLPLKAKERDMVVLIGERVEDLKIVDLRPWH